MSAWIAKTQWGWTLFYGADIVCSADHADDVYAYALTLDLTVYA